MAGDVTIIGAGLIGASVAWRLAQAGSRVSLFDAGTFGGETSSAGAGMLSPGGEFVEPSRWLDLGIEGMRMYPAFVDELRKDSGVSIDFQICGCLQLDVTEPERRVAFHRSAGIRVEQRPDGLFYPDDGYVDPGDLLQALRRVCENLGVRIAERCSISEIESSEHGAVVIAAGAWSGNIRVKHRGVEVALPKVSPIKGHLIGFDLEPGSVGAMLRRGHTYVLQRSNGFTVVGSTEEESRFDRTVDPGICEDIHRRGAELFPALAKLTPSKRWIGFRPYSADGPHIGRIPGTNVSLAYGHFRNGILLAPLTAQRIAQDYCGNV